MVISHWLDQIFCFENCWLTFKKAFMKWFKYLLDLCKHKRDLKLRDDFLWRLLPWKKNLTSNFKAAIGNWITHQTNSKLNLLSHISRVIRWASSKLKRGATLGFSPKDLSTLESGDTTTWSLKNSWQTHRKKLSCKELVFLALGFSSSNCDPS